MTVLNAGAWLQPIDAARAAGVILAHMTSDAAMLAMIIAEATADGRVAQMGWCADAFAPLTELGPEIHEFTATDRWLRREIANYRAAAETTGWAYFADMLPD